MSAVLSPSQIPRKTLPDLVNKLLASRQESLVLFNKLAALKPLTSTATAHHLLRRFRQALIDYLALGPFEVYYALEAQSAASPYGQAREIARRLYARLARTTQAALDFHDRYEGDEADLSLADLTEDLSDLGEALATRIELEDQIVAAVRQADLRIAA